MALLSGIGGLEVDVALASRSNVMSGMVTGLMSQMNENPS